MSACLVLQTNNEIFIGADSAASKAQDGKFYRIHDYFNKLHVIDNSVVFVSGIYDNCWDMVDFLNKCGTSNIKTIENHLRKKYGVNTHEPIDGVNASAVNLLICKVKNGRAVAYSFEQLKGYKHDEITIEEGCTYCYAAGIKVQETLEYGTDFLKRKCAVEDIFRKTFKKTACNYVGGFLSVYQVSTKKLIVNERIEEGDIEYITDMNEQMTKKLIEYGQQSKPCLV
jgi:hypothetical protein